MKNPIDDDRKIFKSLKGDLNKNNYFVEYDGKLFNKNMEELEQKKSKLFNQFIWTILMLIPIFMIFVILSFNQAGKDRLTNKKNFC